VFAADSNPFLYIFHVVLDRGCDQSVIDCVFEWKSSVFGDDESSVLKATAPVLMCSYVMFQTWVQGKCIHFNLSTLLLISKKNLDPVRSEDPCFQLEDSN
jgi:hypothetical protein